MQSLSPSHSSLQLKQHPIALLTPHINTSIPSFFLFFSFLFCCCCWWYTKCRAHCAAVQEITLWSPIAKYDGFLIPSCTQPAWMLCALIWQFINQLSNRYHVLNPSISNLLNGENFLMLLWWVNSSRNCMAELLPRSIKADKLE